jgi:Zn finger protein HypA/HybF involved in hydrogenase expression
MQTSKDELLSVIKNSTCKTDILRYYKMLYRSAWLEKELSRHGIENVKALFRKKNSHTVHMKCECCNKEFYVKDSFYDLKRRFCSRSCANTAEPRRIKKVKSKFVCIQCNNEFISRSPAHSNKYCSNDCYVTYRKKQALEKFKKGDILDRNQIRKIISDIAGYNCIKCGISEWNKKPITLQVNHIDGNPGNNIPSNLELICPNCHSQTDTFGGKNKGYGRKSRGISLS